MFTQRRWSRGLNLEPPLALAVDCGLLGNHSGPEVPFADITTDLIKRRF